MPQNNKITPWPYSQQISCYFFNKYFTENSPVSIKNNYYLELVWI